MMVSHFHGFLFENYLLAVVLPDLPLSLHFLNFGCKFFLSFGPFFDFFDFLTQIVVQLCDVILGTVNVLLIKGLELEDFLFELQI